MTEHYSGHDPATGCGLMLISAAIALVIIVLVALWLLSGATWATP